jgi:hypothetical protein
MTNRLPHVDAAEREFVERSFAAIFESTDPFGDIYCHGVEARAILFPIETALEKGQYVAVADAAGRIDETEAFFRWAENPEDLRGPIWRVPLKDFDSYARIADNRGWDSALWSTAGTWGIFISHEGHGVVGGPERFIESLLAGFPETEQTTMRFVVTQEMPRPKLDDPDPAARIDQMVDHYRGQGAEINPPVRVGARDQGFAFALDCARSMTDEGADITWLPSFLRHIYGLDEASKILERAGLETLRIDVDDDR